MFIRVDWLIDEDDVVRASFAAAPRGRRFCWIAATLLALTAVGLYVSYRVRGLPWNWAGTAWFAAAVCFFLLLPRCGALAERRQFRRSGRVKESFTFTEEGVTVNFVNVHGEWQAFRAWSCFHRLESTDEFFLLHMDQTTCSPVPKRVFDPEALALFSRFVEYGFADLRATKPLHSECGDQAHRR